MDICPTIMVTLWTLCYKVCGCALCFCVMSLAYVFALCLRPHAGIHLFSCASNGANENIFQTIDE